MTWTAVSGDDRARAAAAVTTWLATLWDRREELTVDQELLARCCGLLSREWAETPSAAELPASTASDLDGGDALAGRARDPYLALLYTALSVRCGGRRDDDRELLARAAAEPALSTPPADPPVELRRVASLLAVLGVTTALASFRRELPSIESLYLLDAPQVEQTCHDLAVATSFGTAPNALPVAVRASLELPLSAIALAYLRDYRLDLGCLAVRTLRYLEVGRKAIEQAASFLLLQQQNRGCFGLLSQPGLQRLHERGAELDLEVYLPTTFECLWTLAVVDGTSDPVHSPPAVRTP